MVKPSSCSGCELHHLGSGFVPPYRGPAAGATGRRVLFLGESPGGLEIIRDEPFVGPAGGKLNHLTYLLGLKREQFDIHNTISCRPPNDWLEGAPWEAGAVAHCRPNLDVVLQGLPAGSVIVPMGGTATRRILGLSRAGFELKNFHGTVSAYGVDPLEGLPGESSWDTPTAWEEDARRERFTGNFPVKQGLFVVPTFHPAHLIRGAHNLTGIVLFDLQRALDVAAGGWQGEPASLVLDPPPAWFEAWVEAYLAAVAQDPLGIWLSVDIETPDKEQKIDEGELKTSDRSYIITRVNFSFSPDEGVTVPFDGPYITLIGRLLRSIGAKCFWNKSYDLKRLWRIYGIDGISGPLLDFMDAWHALHSDVPKGLGFVASFYSGWGPWKHLSGFRPALYGALDGVQNHRCAFGIAKDLHSQGMWDVFWRHMHLVDQNATSLSCRVGLKINRRALEGYEDENGQHIDGMRDKLRKSSRGFYEKMQELVPAELRPLHPSKDGWTRKPPEAEFLLSPEEDPLQIPRPVFEVRVKRKVNKCLACGAEEVPKRHRCKTEDGKANKNLLPVVQEQDLEVSRFFVRRPFNPGSWQQVLAYIKWAGHKPGRNKGKETTNRETIERLSEGKPRNKADGLKRELYPQLLDFRDVKKVLGTYVEGTLNRLDAQKQEGIDDERLHPTVTNNPSTLRTSYVDPNLQNVVADRRGGESLSAGFREAVEAEEGAVLVELDWSAIESVLTGWKMGDPQHIKLSYLGVHSHLACLAMGLEVDPNLPAKELSAYYKAVKKEMEKAQGGVWTEREVCKRVVHGTHYLLSPFGMAKRFRKLFPSEKIADKLQGLYYAMAPKLKPWQQQTQELAHKQHYLGGAGAHPFGYKHEFWNVFDFERITWQEAGLRRRRGLPTSEMGGWWYAVKPGEDAKRAVAFFPQSIAAGIIRETALQLFTPGGANYIGEAFHGKTPLRAIIHDSFLLEVPIPLVDRVVEAALREMTRPFLELPCPREWGLGAALRVGVGVKVGKTWAKMEEVQVPEWAQVLGGEISGGILDEEPDDDEGGENESALFATAAS